MKIQLLRKLPGFALFVYAVLLLPMLAACGTQPEKTVAEKKVNWKQVHKISIVNASNKVINTIQYKPCGTQDNKYHYLTGNIKPQEKLTMNIYTHCVDLRAMNAFKKKLVDVKNVDLKAIRTWTIK